MARSFVYYVYDKETEDLVASGTAKECAAIIGVHPATIQGASIGSTPMRSYYVERSLPVAGNEQEELAAQWDAFCEPIRKRYGIKVKRDGDAKSQNK